MFDLTFAVSRDVESPVPLFDPLRAFNRYTIEDVEAVETFVFDDELGWLRASILPLPLYR